ncbi:fatty acid desaturase domain-containing protein [Trichoderma compactum]
MASSPSETRTQATKPQPSKDLVDSKGNQAHIPDFSYQHLLNSIPKHCFEKSAILGLGYVLRDIGCLIANFCFYHYVTGTELVTSLPTPFKLAIMFLYTFIQGLFATGIWVIAHECGHHSFSSSPIISDIVGYILHTSLLVPYFSWQISHAQHHRNTNNTDRDVVYLPRTREKYAKEHGLHSHTLSETVKELPIITAIFLVGGQLLAWPLYLFTNVTSHNNYQNQPGDTGPHRRNGVFGGINHFDPKSPIFSPKDRFKVHLSNFGLCVVLFIIVRLGQLYGWGNVAVEYLVPWLWVNHWQVAITYLNHTDPELPHYQNEVWTYVRGAGATIDRRLGFIGKHLFHGVAETHVLHHYIPSIPFYHAAEATDALKIVMGKSYHIDPEIGIFPFTYRLWQNVRSCHWVEENKSAKEGNGIVFFRNRNRIKY